MWIPAYAGMAFQYANGSRVRTAHAFYLSQKSHAIVAMARHQSRRPQECQSFVGARLSMESLGFSAIWDTCRVSGVDSSSNNPPDMIAARINGSQAVISGAM